MKSKILINNRVSSQNSSNIMIAFFKFHSLDFLAAHDRFNFFKSLLKTEPGIASFKRYCNYILD